MNHLNHTPRAYHLMAKPAGPLCNLACDYCFYLEKEHLFPNQEQYRMSDAVLESYIRQYIQTQDVPEIYFGWQGGEPTLVGIEFYQKAVDLQKKYADGKRISNSFQTNGILLDDNWGEFLARNQFLIGLSIDGPRELHDGYRLHKNRKPTFEQVMQAVDILEKYQVEFNTVTCVHRKNMNHPIAVYRFLKEINSNYLQFIPIVERQPDNRAISLGYKSAFPPLLSKDELKDYSPVTQWSVDPRQFGQFLIEIFDAWVQKDVGKIFVQYFDVALNCWVGLESPLCIFAYSCGKALVIEHNGIIYSCDHYVYPEYALGNLLTQPLDAMIFSEQQTKFGKDKEALLPDYCRNCEVRFACNGGCLKHRFSKTPNGDPSLNYLCPGYKLFFNHIQPYMEVMAQLVRSGRPASLVMQVISELEKVEQRKNMGPNDLCYCGSGKKYKKCCAKKGKRDTALHIDN